MILEGGSNSWKVKGLESDAHISVSIETFRVEDFFSELESLWPLERITNFVRLTQELFTEISCHLQQSCRHLNAT